MVNAYGEKLVAINLDRMAHYIGRGIKISNDVEQLLGEYEFEIMIFILIFLCIHISNVKARLRA